MSPGLVDTNNMISRFIGGFDQGIQEQKIQAIMQQLSGVFDPVQTPPAGDGVGPPASAPAGRTDVAKRLLGAVAQHPEGLAIIDKMFGDYFKPGTPQAPVSIGEHGTYDPGAGKVIHGSPKVVNSAPGHEVMQVGPQGVLPGGHITPYAPTAVGQGQNLVDPNVARGGTAPIIASVPPAPVPGMFKVLENDKGGAQVIDIAKGTATGIPGAQGKVTPSQKPIEGYDAQGNLVLIGYDGAQVPIPGIKHSEWVKMTIEQKQLGTDKLYAQLVQKWTAGTATPQEKQAMDILAKFKESPAMVIQQMQDVGSGKPVEGKTWQDKPETPPAAPAPEKKGIVGKAVDFFKSGTPDSIKIEQAPGGGGYNFLVGKEKYGITPKGGQTPEAVKQKMNSISKALETGLTLDEIINALEVDGYNVMRPNAKR